MEPLNYLPQRFYPPHVSHIPVMTPVACLFLSVGSLVWEEAWEGGRQPSSGFEAHQMGSGSHMSFVYQVSFLTWQSRGDCQLAKKKGKKKEIIIISK